jgi:hypothetical protein
VDVLQHALGVVGHLEAEVRARPLAPRVREVGRVEVALEQRELELEAQDDVQAVRDLVGRYADRRGPHDVDRAVDVLPGVAAEALRERALQVREAPAPEARAATDHVLPQPALRLVDRARDARPERRAGERGVDVRLVQAVTELVERAEDRVEVVLGVAGRQPHVARRDRGRERVDRVVQAPAPVVDADLAQDRRDQLSLGVDRERSADDERVVRGDRRGLDERDEAVAHPPQRVLGVGRAHARLEVVEQRVVGALDLGKAGDVAPAQLDVAAQVRLEEREVRGLARPRPRLVAGRAGVRHLLDELARHPPRLVEVAAADAQEVGVEVGLGRRGREQLSDAVVDEAVVGEPLERRALLRAPLGARRRHHDLLVPAEQHRHPLEVRDLGEAAAELGERGGGHGHGPAQCGASGAAVSRAELSPPPRATTLRARAR